ncbi:MAG: glycosyltransferase family 4 protein [Lachnospiraceae bacterium]|nr:glycosyltransferase family 4 protein [Lachnospiraceae bacterium]
MKILITSDMFTPAVNGVVTSTLNLIKGLKEDGHDVRILTLSESAFEKKENNVYYMPALPLGAIYPEVKVMLPPVLNILMEELVDWNPDIIHSQCEFSTFIYARMISKRTGAPIVHTYHTVYENYTHYLCPSKTIGRKAAIKFTNSISKHVTNMIVPSGKMYRMLSDYEINAPLTVIPTGINTDKYLNADKSKRDTLRAEYGIGKDEFILLYAGRLAKEKNLEEILDFLADSRLNNLRLIVVGDGPHRETLEDKCKENGIENRVIFTGMVSPEKIEEYYLIGDVFVSASQSETQGLTYIEAMVSGLPLLCREDECLTDVIENGTNGYLYKDKEDFIKMLMVLLNDKEKRISMGQNARRTVLDHFSERAFVKSCEKLYTKTISEFSRNVNGNLVSA